MTDMTDIESSDFITDSREVINNNFFALYSEKEFRANKSDDSTLSANSDTLYPTQRAVKAYVDAGGNVNASTTTKGIVELATSAEIDAGTATGGTGASLVVTADALKGSLAPIVRKYENSGSPHTWSKPAGLKYIVVEVVGGGGGGGAMDGAGGSPDNLGSGGGAGGYSRKLISTGSLGSSETVTVGAGGAGGTVGGGGTGATGGTVSFGTHCSAAGGAGGGMGLSGGVGGVGSSGDINTKGGGGGGAGNDSGPTISGMGGASFFGAGGEGRHGVDSASSGGNYGGGGGGASKNSNVDVSGGAGGDGVCIVTEYYV